MEPKAKGTRSAELKPDLNLPPETERLIRLPEVMRLTSLSKAQVYALIAKTEFPRQIPLGGAVAWTFSSVMDWIAKRIAAAASSTPGDRRPWLAAAARTSAARRVKGAAARDA